MHQKTAMKRNIALSLLIIISTALHSQLEVSQPIGKYSHNSTTGFGIFVYDDLSLNDVGNRSLQLEFDFLYFPRKSHEINSVIALASIRVGYKYVFSEESKTGFYLLPSAGYCRVGTSDDPDPIIGNGVALAAEAGYNLEVGNRGNNFAFGLKYETDIASAETSISSIAFRVSYAFHLFKKRSD